MRTRDSSTNCGRPVDEHGRVDPPLNAGEFETLVGFLEWQRSTLAWKTEGLDRAGLTKAVPSASMTLGGILKHMAWVEDHWFSFRLLGREREDLWRSIDWVAEPDWEWTSAADDSPDELRTLWIEAIGRSRVAVNDVFQEGGLDRMAARVAENGSAPSLRWILVHMIEEYARHNGHADFLREAVDGQVGE